MNELYKFLGKMKYPLIEKETIQDLHKFEIEKAFEKADELMRNRQADCYKEALEIINKEK